MIVAANPNFRTVIAQKRSARTSATAFRERKYKTEISGQASRSASPAKEHGSLEEQHHAGCGAMESAGGNQSEAARILRIGRYTLRYKLKKFNLDVTGRRTAR